MTFDFSKRLVGSLDNRFARAGHTLFKLIRIRNCFIVFFGVVVGATLVHTGPGIFPTNAGVYVAGLSAALIMAGGNTLNDYFDLGTDKINKPNRPIPAGKVSRSDALMLAIGLFLVGVGLAKSINGYCLAIALVNTIMLILYAVYSKRLLLISNINISYLVASVFLYGALSLGGGPILSQSRFVAVLAGCAFFMTFSREIVKDIEDVEGDRKTYAVTLPIKVGVGKARAIAMFFGLIAILLSVIPYFLRYPEINRGLYGSIIAIADLAFVSALTMYAPLGQRIMIVGMVFSLLAFFFGSITT